jgi:hypothetical protein
MRPTLGRVVLYTRAAGEEFAARITRVESRPLTADLVWLETRFDVWLAVDIHNASRGETWFTPSPIRFSDEPASNTWRWPPRV